MKKLLTTTMALLLLGATTASAQTDRHVYDNGNNAHYIAKGDHVIFSYWDEGSSSRKDYDGNRNGYKVLPGWFGDNVTTLDGSSYYEWNGPTGAYSFKALRGEFIDVRPMNLTNTGVSTTADDKYWDYITAPTGMEKAAGFEDATGNYFSTYNTSDGTGNIWISGGTNFGFPSGPWSGIVGWTNPSGSKFGDNTIAVYSAGDKKHSIQIKTGLQITRADDFIFKLYHKKNYETFWKKVGETDEYFKYYEFRRELKNDTNKGEDFSTAQSRIDFRSKPDYLQITHGTDANPSYDEGNIKAANIDFDSWLPKMPDGYTFQFDIDLTDFTTGTPYYHPTESFSNTLVPLGVTQVASDWSATSKKNGDVYELDLNDGSGNKRITLRDALRFDGGLEYDKQYNPSNLNNVDPLKLKIKGILSIDTSNPVSSSNEGAGSEPTYQNTDWAYLTWLAQHNKLATLDLTEATWDGMSIPDFFARDDNYGGGGESSNLTEVKVPDNLQNIGKKAFIFCENLTNVNEIISHVHGTIGDAAFQGCKQASFSLLELSSDVTSLGYNAFQDCTSLTKVVVSDGAAAETWPEAYTINEATDGTTYSHNTNNNIGSTVGSKATLEAEDFNSGTDGTVYQFEVDYASDGYRTDGINCEYKDEASNKRHICNMRAGDFAKYTFHTSVAGKYEITVMSARQDAGDRTFKFEIDGTSAGSVTNPGSTGSWSTYKEQSTGTEVKLAAGDHVLKVNFPEGVNPDVFYIELKSLKTTGGVTTCQANTFQGVNANHCEVDFSTKSVSDENIAAYRAQAGWLYLVTKDIYENVAYDVCNQEHADVRLHRVFNTEDSKWNTLVLPFDVTTDQVKAKNDNFMYPAYLIDNVETGSKTMRFLIVNDENEETYHNKLEAGKPFIIYVETKDDSKDESSNADPQYTFVDVTTKETPDAIKPYDGKTQAGHTFTFQGTYKTTDTQNNVYLIRNGSMIFAQYAAFRGYRGWFTYSDPDAKELSFLYTIDGLDTTEIVGINARGEVTAPKNIYNLSGQLVRSNAVSTEGLPKGLYIVNGKKIVVK